MVAVVVGPVVAQSHPRTGWEIRTSPFADLWYHGLAVVGFQGFAPLPMYAADYVTRVRAAKRAAGVFPTPLDTLAPRLRTAFDSDSTYEILHFLPVYFAAARRGGGLTAMRAALEGRAYEVTDPATKFGARVLGATVTGRAQRTLLLAFLDALEQEWSRFVEHDLAASGGRRRATVAAAQRVWRDELAPGLGDALRRRHLHAGVILASPVVGPEGRIFTGDPSDPGDNVVIVSLPPDPARAPSIALAAVREMCFPVVSRIVAASGIARRDRVEAERMSSRAAVRCGAVMLADGAPAFLPAYRSLYREAIGVADDTADWAALFPVSPPVWDAIHRELEVP